MRKCAGFLGFVVAVSGTLLVSEPARAQQQVQVAATAFAEGQQAQLRGDFVRAAELFEIADQSVPSPAALRSAIRNREAAGQDVRAATLSLRALERYAEDRETRTFVEGVIARLSPKLARIQVRCSEPCSATADGGLVTAAPAASMEFFVSPGPHTLRASWPGRPELSRALDAAVGQTLEVKFDAPPPGEAPAPASAPPAAPAESAPAASVSSDVLAPSSGGEPADHGSRGLSPAFFWVGAGLTAVAGGVLVWSGLDTLSARDDYEENPTRDGYDDGVDREKRTNILIGATTALGLATIGIGLFATDWKGSSSRAALRLGPARAELSWSGELP